MNKEQAEKMRTDLESRTAFIRSMLPEHIRHEAERFVSLAYMYFIRRAELHDVSPASFVQCVLDSAELGIPLNGRLGHAVPYNCKVSRKGEPERWERRSQFMPDWKGLIAVAKRTNQIKDAYADVVCEKDQFEAYRENDKSFLRHVPGMHSRGAMIGAYCIYKHHSGDWRYEYMTGEQILHVRSKSKAADNGPWVTDFDQMAIKTVVRRGLKFYSDDPTLIRALEYDDQAIDVHFERTKSRAVAQPIPSLEYSPPTDVFQTAANEESEPVASRSSTVPRKSASRKQEQSRTEPDWIALDAELGACETDSDIESVRVFWVGKHPEHEDYINQACDKSKHK